MPTCQRHRDFAPCCGGLVVAVLVAALISAATAQPAGVSRLSGPAPSQIPAPRLMFYSLMLGDQPQGVITWFGMVEPLLREERIQAERQRQIEALQARLSALRAAQAQSASPRPALGPVVPPPTSTRVVPGTAPPARRPAAGFQRYGHGAAPR